MVTPLSAALDWVMDKSLVLGYTRLGPRIRRSWWPDDPRPASLAGRHVLVTGASGGLGLATAQQLAGRIFTNTGLPDESVFATSLAELAATDRPLRLFSEAGRWQSVARGHAGSRDTKAKIDGLFNDCFDHGLFDCLSGNLDLGDYFGHGRSLLTQVGRVANACTKLDDAKASYAIGDAQCALQLLENAVRPMKLNQVIFGIGLMVDLKRHSAIAVIMVADDCAALLNHRLDVAANLRTRCLLGLGVEHQH